MTHTMSYPTLRPRLWLAALGLIAPLCATQAGEPFVAAAAAAPEQSIYDQLWALPVLYNNEDNPVVQQFALKGRAQFDWFRFENEDADDSDWIVRRIRLGAQLKFLRDLTLHGEVDLDLQDPDPAYNKLTDAYLKWAVAKEFNVVVGKHGAKFTLDGSTSSTQLITIDRSNIANNFWFPEEYIPGISFNGEVGNWFYNVGYFSSGGASPEFGEFNAGSFGLASLGYNLSEALGVDKALVRADYVYQNEDPGNTFTRSLEQVGSLNFQIEQGRWGFATDVVAAQGYGKQPDLYGMEAMPSYYFLPGLQAVLRYTYIHSDGNNGIRLARYENRLVSGRGDEYQEIYAGLNWYLYGHKAKIQAGIQYTTLDDAAGDGGDYEGWGVTTGLRLSW